MGTVQLLDRERELAQLATIMSAAERGQGGALLIEGEAGIGKTALLDEAAANAGREGLKVLRARGGELEHAFAFGIARQLVEREVGLARGPRRMRLLAGQAALAEHLLAESSVVESPVTPDPFSVHHGLYWLLSNLADERPTALIVDDLHWSDESSLQFLLHLVRRLDGLRVAVTMAVRLDEPRAQTPVIQAIRGEAAVEVLRLESLTAKSVAILVTRAAGPKPDAEFVNACLDVSGGNPFLMAELLRTLAGEGVVPKRRSVGRVREAGTVAVAGMVLNRLSRVSALAIRLAEAAAVLDSGAAVRDGASLARLRQASAEVAADELEGARIFHRGPTLEFMHPLVRTAIYENLAAGRRSRDHKRAARILAKAHAPADRVCAHLLASQPSDDPWVAEVLLDAAADAFTRADPAVATQLLRRALEEPPSPSARPTVLECLGVAELLAGIGGGLEHLADARGLISAPLERARIARLMVRELAPMGRIQEGAKLVEESLHETEGRDSELATKLNADRLMLLIVDRTVGDDTPLRQLEGSADELDGATPSARALLANLCYLLAKTGAPVARVRSVALLGLGDGRLVEEQSPNTILPCMGMFALVYAEDYANAAREAERMLHRGQQTGSVLEYAIASTVLMWAALRRGALIEAIAYGSAASAAFPRPRAATLAIAISVLTEAFIERGDLPAAEAELARHGVEDGVATSGFLLESRGRLHAARGDFELAVRDLQESGRRHSETGDLNPALSAWRSHVAIALLRLGRTEEALQLAREELDLARAFGAPRSIAMALRAVALTGPPGGATALLEEAAMVIESSPAVLARAYVLVDLGAALRRANQRTAARARLEVGLDLSHRCGAVPLEHRALEELRACGARPRRLVVEGVDSLTGSELRVCQLAAGGLSNPEIAQALFITRATVESHLHSAYNKLGVASRNDLRDLIAVS